MQYSNSVPMSCHRRSRRGTSGWLAGTVSFAFLTLCACEMASEPGTHADCDASRARVAQLEHEAAALRSRLAEEEPDSVDPIDFAPREAWKHREAWRRLHRGMSQYEVMATLGEPGRIVDYGSFERWEYPDFLGGRVTFDDRGTLRGIRPPPRRKSTPVGD